MAARRRRSKLTPPRFPLAMPSLPRSHRATKAKPEKAPPEPPAPRSRVKTPGANTRAQLATRAGTGRSGMGARVTPLNDRDDRYGTRNYPPNVNNVRQRNSRTSHLPTRSQLAVRDAVRDAQGYAPTKPHPKSGELARSNVKAVGRAAAPPRPLPGDPSPRSSAAKRRKRVETFGADFAGPMTRAERAERDAQPVHPFFRDRKTNAHIGRPPT